MPVVKHPGHRSGDFAFDPSLVHNSNGSLELHLACLEAGKHIAGLQPDLILLSTPHGIEITNDFLFYQNSLAAGFARIGGDLHNSSFPLYDVPLNTTVAVNVTNDLLQHLLVAGLNVSGIKSFAGAGEY